MKKQLFFLTFFLIISRIFATETTFELINNNNFNLQVKTTTGIYVGDLRIQNGIIVCSYPLINANITVTDSLITIYADKIKFDRNTFSDNKSFRQWYFPERYKMEITNMKLLNIKEFGKYVNNSYVGNFYESELIIENELYPTSCKAIVVDNLNIRSEPSLKGNIIGIIRKGDEVTLYGNMGIKEKIDNIESYWYKIKFDDKIEGWIFGGYVKIFFENIDLDKEDKAGILNFVFSKSIPTSYSFNAVGLFDNSISAHITIINNCVRCYSPWTNVQVLRENENIIIFADKLIHDDENGWKFPKRYKILISKSDLENLKKYPEGYGMIYFDDRIQYPTTCNALVIKDTVIYNSPLMNSKKIAKMHKAEEVCLLEDDITKNGFYKVKINENKQGWIHVDSVRIFFDRNDNDKIEKAGILKSLASDINS